MQARLDREEQQQRELVGPVEVVGDHDVVASALARDVLAAVDLEPKSEPEHRDRQPPNQPVGQVRARADRQQVCLGQCSVRRRHGRQSKS